MAWPKATDPNKPPKQQQYDMAELRRKAMAYLKNNPIKFIENFVYIESKDGGEPIIPFKLWKEQKEAVKSILKNKINIILKARQLGFSWLALAIAAYFGIFNAGFTTILLSRTELEAKELVRRLHVILSHMPELIAEKGHEPQGWTGLTYTKLTLSITINHPNGLESTYTGFTSSPGVGRSFTADLIILDEWAYQDCAAEIWQSGFPTINRPGSGKVIGLSTIARGTLFEEIWVDGDPSIYNKLFIPWHADPRRTQEWYDNTKKVLGDLMLAEYPATPEEALMVPGGSYFPEINYKTHIRQPLDFIPDYYRKYVALDYGLDMLAVHWIWIDEEGYRRVYRELDASDLTISAACAAIREANCGDKIDLYLAPVDLWNRSQESGRSRADIFAENGITLTRSSNNRENGCAALKEDLKPIEAKNAETGELYKTAKLTIDADAAPNLWRCLNKIQKDAKKPNIYADMPHELTHDVDSLRYFSVYWTIEAQKPVEEFKLWHMPERKRRSY